MKKIMGMLAVFCVGIVTAGDWTRNPFAKEDDPFADPNVNYGSITAGGVRGKFPVATSRQKLGLDPDFVVGGAEGKKLARERIKRLERLAGTGFIAEQVREQRESMGETNAECITSGSTYFTSFDKCYLSET